MQEIIKFQKLDISVLLIEENNAFFLFQEYLDAPVQFNRKL